MATYQSSETDWRGEFSMRLTKKIVGVLFVAALLLILHGCSGGNAEDVPSVESPVDEITMSASFQQEDGGALCDSLIRLSFGESTLERSLNDRGELKLSGLPRMGDWILTVLDPQEQIQGGMTIFLSEGTIIDATTSESGIGYITLRGDTDEVALLFLLKNDGSLFCSLQLTQPDSHDLDLSQEDYQCGT